MLGRQLRRPHEHVIQRLLAIGLALNSIHGRVRPPEVADRLNAQIDDLDRIIRDIRMVIFHLQAEPGSQLHLRRTE